MEKIEIDKFLKNLENDIKTTQSGIEQSESLERLKGIAKKYEGDDEVIDSNYLVERMKLDAGEYKILSGWSQIDAILGGFRLSQLIVISALTKSGKTSFCMDLTRRMFTEHPMWLPFEEGGDELISKYIERKEEIPKFYLPKSNKVHDIQWVESRIIESIAKYDSKVVFIDHLDFIVPFTSTERHDLLVAKTMRDLKQMAKRWKVLIFLIAHLKQAKFDQQPDLESLRGSASIAQEADTVIMLWRQNKKEDGKIVIGNEVNVSIQANRRTGKTGNIGMIFNDGKFIQQAFAVDPENELTKNW